MSGDSGPKHAPELNADLSVVALRVEHLNNPIGIGTVAPRLSWQIMASCRGVMQSAYQIRVAPTEESLQSPSELLWDSGKVSSAESILQPYAGPVVESGRCYHWHVRVWDLYDAVSAWSAPAQWEMGLLSAEDWKAQWIELLLKEHSPDPCPLPLLRRTFRLRHSVSKARAHVTSHGLYEMHLNGLRVEDQLFTPGWTSYNKRLQYQTYDVTSCLREGPNAVGMVLANGWYRGRLGLGGGEDTFVTNYYGRRLGALLQIIVTYDTGEQEIIRTDGEWRWSTGPILMSEIYAGESYDARLEKPGWTEAGYCDANWSPVKVVPGRKDILVAPVAPPVRRIQELKPVRIFTTPGGDTVADLGQNIVGWVKLTVAGTAGTIVTLRHAEVLNGAGDFYTANLGTAAAKVSFTLKGGGVETFEPHFTFQGFRYVAVCGYPGELMPEHLTGVVIHSDLASAGEFACSSEALNQLYRNIVWSQKGNFLDVPTDCPQRDERLGWTGDAQAFSATASFNMDVAGFFAKWLADLAADQDSTGRIPWVVPDINRTVRFRNGIAPAPGGAAGWGDAATIIPWNLYQAYGDVRILADQYESMRRWVQYEQERAGDDLIWSDDFQFGDWMDFFGEDEDSGLFTSTPTDFIATAYFAHSVTILQRTAAALGKHDDEARFGALLELIKAAFNARFVANDGAIAAGTQSAYVLALHFDLLPQPLRALAAALLAKDVRARGHLTTGFLGTPHLLEVLSRYGYIDEAYLLLNRRDFPSWLYPVSHGATTMWERWDAIEPDGSFQPEAANSFNHYAYGSVGEWMFSVMAGIRSDLAAPGYRYILIEPHPGGGITSVSASHHSPYGRIFIEWAAVNDKFILAVEIPPNSRGTVRLPRCALTQVTESGKPLSRRAGIIRAWQDERAVVIEVGSGSFEFETVTASVLYQ